MENELKIKQIVKQIVKEKYSKIASLNNTQSCCSGCCCTSSNNIMSENYNNLNGYHPDADLGLGCGLPTNFAKIKKGDTVIDLGSGAGNDCFIATFVSGGTAIDAIRNIWGYCKILYAHTGNWGGALYDVSMKDNISGNNGNNNVPDSIGLDASRVVPTATDNRVRTLSERFWRRVA
jgi:hypothetical protein